MITYFDTSSLLKLLIEEEGSDRASLLWDSADAVVSVALVVVESRAALAAARRGNRISTSQHQRAVHELELLVDELAIVEVTGDLLSSAAQLAEMEGLRGYDAVHLAAALAVEATVFSSADSDLCLAALHRGLHVTNPLVVCRGIGVVVEGGSSSLDFGDDFVRCFLPHEWLRVEVPV